MTNRRNQESIRFKRTVTAFPDRLHLRQQDSIRSTPGYLQQFAEVAEQVAATTKKLEKAALVGAYLKQLNDADLGRAARYFAGHQFASNDARTTNVGGAIINAALCEATGFTQRRAPTDLRETG